MLTIYRRHKLACKHRDEGRDYRRCQCPIWVDGSLAGQEIRKSLNERDWQKAQDTIREWEAEQEIHEDDAPVTLQSAWEQMIAYLESQHLALPTVGKYRLLRRQMTAFAEDQGLTLLSQFDFAMLNRFRATWKEATRTSRKKLERLRAFFKFCCECGWTTDNPAKKIKSPKGPQLAPTMPLTHEEWIRLLTACDNLRLSAKTSIGKLIAHRLKTLILLMRYTGLRISDAVTLSTERIEGNKILVVTAKTGVPVYTILPDSVVRALEETPRMTGTLFFWNGESRPQTAIGEWQERIKNIFDAAGIESNGHAVSHRLRDTFAVELLLAGVPIERVSKLLGHQSIGITDKHYSPWTRSRQEQIEADLAAAWERDPSLENFSSGPTKGTRKVHEKTAAVN